MKGTDEIMHIVERELADGELFPVEVRVCGDEIEVFIDSDRRGPDGRPLGVAVDDCVALTKAIEAQLDRDAWDFSLTVSSAGIGSPLRVPRQYKKLVGRPVELVLADGTKILGTLDAADGESIAVSYDEKQKAPGAKRPELVRVSRTLALADVKTTREHIDFK